MKIVFLTHSHMIISTVQHVSERLLECLAALRTASKPSLELISLISYMYNSKFTT